MKTRKLLFTMVTFLIAGTMVFAQEMKTEKFKVYGNCGMCESRIEKAAKSVDGVSRADWDQETKMIEVAFDKSKTDVHKVHMAIAKAGHDTDMHKAKDETYDALPGCCKYERKSMEKKHMHGEGDHGHKHNN
jgi:copper chaperone CopZ